MNHKPLIEHRPWVEFYSPGVPADVEIKVQSLGELFDEVIERWRNRTALVFYGHEITYLDLRDKVYRFANALSHLGIKKGDTVAFLLLNSPEFVIAFYAAAKLGAIITLISPVYVSGEIKHQYEDSGAETIICQDMLYEAVEKTGLKIKNVILTNITDSFSAAKRFFGKKILRGVYQKMTVPNPKILQREGFYAFKELIKKYPADPPEIQIDAKKDILVLPYTSGTTGPPKGVMLTHYNVIADETLYYSFYPIFEEGRDVMIGYMPFYHAAGLMTGVISAIRRGTTLVIITNPDLDDILYSISKYGATFFIGAPAIYEALNNYEKTDRVNWKKLKAHLSGADALHEATATDWKMKTGFDIHECYGMTEFTCNSHQTPLGRVKSGSMGVPLPSTVATILDPDEDRVLPPNEMGEIVVSGLQVTEGYWNNPEATRQCEAWINGIRWWRTGDLGKMDEEGYFYIYDRKRDLIKYKGLRVYAREVEEVLKTHPAVKEVGVIGVPDIKVGENVKAYVVLEGDAKGQVSEQDIIDYCSGKLAHYKIPKVVEFIGEIPRTDIGKASRRELREYEG